VENNFLSGEIDMCMDVSCESVQEGCGT
jgi:hypothetical protein